MISKTGLMIDNWKIMELPVFVVDNDAPGSLHTCLHVAVMIKMLRFLYE